MKTKLPIIMSQPMILAHLEDRKTQTRRTRGLEGLESWLHHGYLTERGKFYALFTRGEEARKVRCPYGGPGGTLYVREGIRRVGERMGFGGTQVVDVAEYIADGATAPIDNWGWKNQALPAIHMPAGCSRFELDLLTVTVERLHYISEADAIAEGMVEVRKIGPSGVETFVGWGWPGEGMLHDTAVQAYRAGWLWLNGATSWDLNPYVWRLSYTPRRTR